MYGGVQLEVFELRVGVVLEGDYRVPQALFLKFEGQGAVFAEAVGVVALGYDHNLRVAAQAGAGLLAESHVGEEEKLQRGGAVVQLHEAGIAECGVEARQRLPGVAVHDVARRGGGRRGLPVGSAEFPRHGLGQGGAQIEEVGAEARVTVAAAVQPG